MPNLTVCRCDDVKDNAIAYYVMKYAVKSQVAAQLMWSTALSALDSCLDFREVKQQRQAQAKVYPSHSCSRS